MKGDWQAAVAYGGASVIQVGLAYVLLAEGPRLGLDVGATLRWIDRNLGRDISDLVAIAGSLALVGAWALMWFKLAGWLQRLLGGRD